jgi:hypothetical protein
MSNSALASAKKKRAQFSEPPKILPQGQFAGRPGVAVPGQSQMQSSSQSIQSPGLTLQQVIQLVDKRLVNLEQYVTQQQAKTLDNQEASMNESIPSNYDEIISEYDNRFQLLAEEIAGMKNMLLKLQSYTMEVNKILMEERIRIFSDLGPNGEEKQEIEEEAPQEVTL